MTRSKTSSNGAASASQTPSALPAWALKAPAEQYIDNIIAGKQVACRWVRLACERHRRDLATGAERRLRFDPDAAQDVLDWFLFLRHSKGEFAGRS